MPELGEIREALRTFAGDPASVGALASALGFMPTPLPRDLLADRGTALAQAFESRTGKVTDRFGVHQLYRAADGPAAGSALYVAVLSDWGARSSSRDRARRRVARAVVQNTNDTRSLILLVPNELERGNGHEIEVVMPRLRERGGRSDLSTVRALVSTSEPSRFHLDLLESLALSPGITLAGIANQWRRAFSVERVTREFYQAYANVRDRIVSALVEANPDHPWVIATGTSEDGDARRREWATRQLGRVLFLWFLQSKRWLGYDGSGEGSPTYLVELWNRGAQSGLTFWSGMLRPLFFEAMAQARPSAEVRALLGDVPFLNGGLFRNSSLEDDVEELGGPLELPDEVFNPAVSGAQPHTVLSLLQRYRFTTRESTPDDQSVDPDPELLGRVFENLYQGDERHDSGTYYTPREVVHFMCRQALDGYLRDATGVDQETLDWLRREVTDPEDSDRALDPDLRERIEAAMDRVRICDPAVGSGAFLLGAMQEMVRLRKGIAHAADEFDAEIEERVEDWKRRAIEHSLYGVDINPEAVEICQLRLWLSLVLDYRGHPREVRPLPNLDFRIRVGDSLIDRFEEVAFVESLPSGSYQAPFELVGKLDGEHEKIERWLSEYEHAIPSRQREIRDLIQKAKLRVLKAQVTAQRDEAASKVSAGPALGSVAKAKQARGAKKAEQALAAYEETLATLDDIEAQRPRVERPFLWPLAFPEVFEGGGFDLVLANPPYVRMEHLDNQQERIYQTTFGEVAGSRADILVYFYARALHLLRRSGRFAFITSNKFMRSNYGTGLRKVFASRTQLDLVVDFGDLPLFESSGKSVAAYPVVVVGRKGAAESGATLAAADLSHPIRRFLTESNEQVGTEEVREVLTDLDGLLAHAAIREFPQSLLRDAGWNLVEPRLLQLFDQLSGAGQPLREFASGHVYRGLVSGLNDAFVINEAQRAELIRADGGSAEIIRPWLRGQDVQRWSPDWAGLYIIFANRGVDIDRYPAIRDHLEQFRPLLEKRATSALHPWYELQQPQEGIFWAFERPKVIWPDIARQMRFAWDDDGYYSGNTTYFIPNVPKWTVAIMNSLVFEFMMCMSTNTVRGGFSRLFSGVLSELPVPEIDDTLAKQLERIVDDCRAGNPESDEIDTLVAVAYGLRPSDLQLIRDWFDARSLPIRGSDAGSSDVETG